MASSLKNTKLKLDLLTDIDLSLMVERPARGGICLAIHRYAKANNKYMQDYDQNKESSYLKFWDVNSWYGWIMSWKLLLGNFKWVGKTYQFNKDFIENYNEDSDEGYFLEVDVQYPKNLHDLYNDLPFLPERMKIRKVGKLVAKWHDEKEYIIHIRNSKQAWNDGLALKKLKLKKSKQWSWKRSFQVEEQCSLWKNHEKCEKTLRYQACNNWSKKELFSVRTKLSYNKKMFR